MVRTEEHPFFRCGLASVPGSVPVLRFRRQQRVVIHEVSIYEVVEEEVTGTEERNRNAMVSRVVPDEEMRGEPVVREVDRDVGPLAGESFLLRGQVVTTDGNGLYADVNQDLLRPFDDLALHTWETTVRHAELGEATLALTRYLTRRWTAEPPDARILAGQSDLLLALGCVYEPRSPAGNSGLRVEVTCPRVVTAGGSIVVRATATNGGKDTVSCLTGRLFSRHPWLAGITLYFGNVQAGERRVFERRVVVPEDVRPGSVYAALGFWDILGPVMEARRPLYLMVEAQAAEGQ
ncbi:MAG: hypothetical protein JXR77_14375 [Lentisphaeria bacterium]|nr:hypothetical protein [Lentisphaeria bacterium]